jgi:hypothetical protein
MRKKKTKKKKKKKGGYGDNSNNSVTGDTGNNSVTGDTGNNSVTGDTGNNSSNIKKKLVDANKLLDSADSHLQTVGERFKEAEQLSKKFNKTLEDVPNQVEKGHKLVRSVMDNGETIRLLYDRYMKRGGKKSRNKRGGFCLPCAAAAGPAGVAAAAVGTVGYYGYKKMKGGTGTGKFKKNEELIYVENDGRTHKVKFKSYYSRKGKPDRATIQFLSRKALRPRSTVNVNKLRTIKKTIMNTRNRQKNRRADTVKRKRDIKVKKNNADDLSVLFRGLFK